MTQLQHQWDFTIDLGKLIEYIRNVNGGIIASLGELWRTDEQQKIYFDSGASKTMNSMHRKKCAIDINFVKDGKIVDDIEILKPYGNFWEALNPLNRWGGYFPKWTGGTFKDVPHFERHI